MTSPAFLDDFDFALMRSLFNFTDPIVSLKAKWIEAECAIEFALTLATRKGEAKAKIWITMALIESASEEVVSYISHRAADNFNTLVLGRETVLRKSTWIPDKQP